MRPRSRGSSNFVRLSVSYWLLLEYMVKIHRSFHYSIIIDLFSSKALSFGIPTIQG